MIVEGFWPDLTPDQRQRWKELVQRWNAEIRAETPPLIPRPAIRRRMLAIMQQPRVYNDEFEMVIPEADIVPAVEVTPRENVPVDKDIAED